MILLKSDAYPGSEVAGFRPDFRQLVSILQEEVRESTDYLASLLTFLQEQFSQLRDDIFNQETMGGSDVEGRDGVEGRHGVEGWSDKCHI